MIEIKLSQGAKPGHGGVLPACKVTPEIADVRGLPAYQTVVSPPRHSAFSTPIQLLEFVARLREWSGGKPVGIKLSIGRRSEFLSICKGMSETGITPDFVTLDGGEGGTGAAPLKFANSMGMPARDAWIFAHNALTGVERASGDYAVPGLSSCKRHAGQDLRGDLRDDNQDRSTLCSSVLAAASQPGWGSCFWLSFAFGEWGGMREPGTRPAVLLARLFSDFRRYRVRPREVLRTLAGISATCVFVNGRIFARGGWPTADQLATHLDQLLAGPDLLQDSPAPPRRGSNRRGISHAAAANTQNTHAPRQPAS